MGRSRKVLGTVGAAWLGAGIALACAGTAEKSAEAWPTGVDGAVPSPFAAQARRGEVAVPAMEQVEHLCALLTGCDQLPIPPSLFPADFQDCVTKMADDMSSPAAVSFSLTIRECGLRADSCASLRACALHGASPEACKGRGRQGVVGFCDVDGRAMTCWHDDVLAVRDCTRGGEQCIVVDGEATCTLGPCSAGAKDGEKARCSASSTHLLHCEKGKLASLDCTAFGLQCSSTGDGTAGCATSGPACTGAAQRCDGNVAVACFNGHEVRIDCDVGGLTCSPSPNLHPRTRAISVGACSAPVESTSACDPKVKAKCDGASIRYCHVGRPRSYSCKELGFHKCDAGKNGVRCAP